jgi:hypothetical protein
VSIWQPGFTPTQGEAMVASIVAHPGTFNAFSATWAFWNSKYNAKCAGSEEGLCGEAFTPAVWNTTLQLRSLGLATVPIVETCCVCVLNASYDFAPAMRRLVADAVANDFAGYAVDIECGGADAPRSIDFFNAFGNAMRALNKTISFWVHYTERPDFSFPNNASYVYTMDTYRYSTRQFVEGWTTAFACQAGIGLCVRLQRCLRAPWRARPPPCTHLAQCNHHHPAPLCTRAANTRGTASWRQWPTCSMQWATRRCWRRQASGGCCRSSKTTP